MENTKQAGQAVDIPYAMILPDHAPGSAGASPPKRLSHVHEMMLNWLVLNPDKSLRECADHFGYTQSWVSTVLHSDLFQAALKEKQLAISVKVAESIPAKLRRVADIAVEKLTDSLERSEDPEFILDATDKILHRMGYAPQSARNPAGSPGGLQPMQQQNNFFVSGGDLAAARELMQLSAERGRALEPVPVESLPE